jgi:hypothetical protein
MSGCRCFPRSWIFDMSVCEYRTKGFYIAHSISSTISVKSESTPIGADNEVFHQDVQIVGNDQDRPPSGIGVELARWHLATG